MHSIIFDGYYTHIQQGACHLKGLHYSAYTYDNNKVIPLTLASSFALSVLKQIHHLQLTMHAQFLKCLYVVVVHILNVIHVQRPCIPNKDK